ncbi:uncharacterized protein LOC110710650 [Chenopodium quinoa]|uniref:uncharacterized protein LOC110710650 n=1 Tax=Chenopodium quinoa TaxID=63459 RepID=UPI000B78DA3A|nr:uncharacterized protein LOC110710650 [Chenopodium quinoa]
MKPPKGYEKGEPGQVCKLVRSIYGLKQASRAWNCALKSFLIRHGYKQSKKDYFMFTKEQNGKQAIILAYVDDLLITGDNLEEIERLKANLDSEFTIKDLRELRFFIGIEVDRNEHGTLLNQRKYILDILKNVGMEDCKIAKFLFPKGMRLSTETGEILAHPEIYRRIVGKLLYLNITRPDISYSVQQLSQFMHCPRKPHLQVALHVIRYLKGTMDWGLYYPRNSELKIEGYSDADWGSCAFSARSLTNYCIFIGQCLVSWKTKKQKTVSKSSTESEYRSMSHTTSELVWVDDIFAKS